MQYQILRALLKVAPAPALDLCLWYLDETSQTGTKQDSDVYYFARVAVRVAGNDNTPPEVLARLAEIRDDDVRLAVACNWHTPPEVLAQLAAVGTAPVREGVAGNLNL